MKRLSFFLITTLAIIALSCSKDDSDDSNSIAGDQSPMGQVGTTVLTYGAPMNGVSNFKASVISLTDGKSSYLGSAIVTNSSLKNVLSNAPQITIIGDSVVGNDVQFKQTTVGIESVAGLRPGILVNYSSGAGTKYTIPGSSDVRTVISKSTTDDYSYGFMLIKVSKIEEPITGALKSTTGLNKITYWANHRFGLVGILFSFNDGTSAQFPIYNSTENP